MLVPTSHGKFMANDLKLGKLEWIYLKFIMKNFKHIWSHREKNRMNDSVPVTQLQQ